MLIRKINNMKRFVKIAFVVIFAAIAGYGAYYSQKSEGLSDVALVNVEALASSRESSVTCEDDKGDTCVVGSTSVPNYDEKDNPWS